MRIEVLVMGATPRSPKRAPRDDGWALTTKERLMAMAAFRCTVVIALAERRSFARMRAADAVIVEHTA
jgi:hypothetical protein